MLKEFRHVKQESGAAGSRRRLEDGAREPIGWSARGVPEGLQLCYRGADRAERERVLAALEQPR